MKETLLIRINKDYANLLFNENEGVTSGTSVKVFELPTDDPRYNQIPIISKQILQKYDKAFFFGWEINRQYNKKELESATLLHIIIKTTINVAGEECGTIYDESDACEICGANRKQKSPLILRANSIPKKDIARTIAGEVIVSEKFAAAVKQRGLSGVILKPIVCDNKNSNYYQLFSSEEIELSSRTVTGINPFDHSTTNEGEIYKCPKGHTFGLNLLSEPYVLNSPLINKYDFLASMQKIGVKRGLLRPMPIYMGSAAFRKMVEDEGLSGFSFELAHISENNKYVE